MRLFTGLILTGLLAIGAAGLGAAEVRRDVVYGEAGGETLRLDVATPDGQGPFPVVILVHGGGWSSGDKAGTEKPGAGADIRPWFEPLTAAGFVWVSINYRLAPANRWPACLEDTRAAVAWVRAHAAEFGGDPERIAIMGHSAGGHIALFAAVATEGGAAPVRAVVGCAAVSDLESDSRRRGGPSASLQALFGVAAEMSPETLALLAAHSPVNALKAGYPPALLLHGDADKTVTLDQSVAFRERVLAVGGDCELHVLPGAGHRLAEWAAKDPAWTRVLTEWLHTKLGPPRPAP
jgi:acetyl esterase/lipase